MSIYLEEAERKSKAVPDSTSEPHLCGVCGKGPKSCSFEKACSCWRGIPCKAGIVAECWTCTELKAYVLLPGETSVGLTADDSVHHRAAGHDVRERKAKS